jgi:hypothetical protein
LNNPGKLNEPVLDLWSRVLAAAPESRLLLRQTDGSARRDLVDFFSSRQVAPKRIDFVGLLPRPDYMRLYNRIDITLDTFPYNGITTTCDALWMGVPVLTMPGKTPVSRAGLGLLSTVGLQEFVAASPQDFVVALAPSDGTGRTVAIVPTRPLQQMTSYMAVMTTGIKNAGGGAIRASLPYLLAERTSPLCNGGQSTVPALPASQACALEPLRQLTNSQEAAATAAGVSPGSIALSWVATTQSTTVVLQAVDAVVEASPPATTHLAPTGKTLADLGVGLPGVADIYIGTIDLPYYLAAPSTDNPTAPLTQFWHAAFKIRSATTACLDEDVGTLFNH